jgi:predicted metal-dependent hydrolase
VSTVKLDDLDFELRRSSNRSTVGITVERDGSLVLSAPESTSFEDLEKVVKTKKNWIYTKIAEKEPLIQSTPKKEYVSGEGFFYLGRSYRLKVIDSSDANDKLRFYRSRFELNRDSLPEGRNLFIKWYSKHLRPILERHLLRLAPRVPVEYRSVQIRDLGYNWGTCGKNQDLYFHWRVAMLPARMVEYVVTHELVHLVEKKHSPEFWSKVETILPDCGERVRWLAENGILYNI